MTVKDVFDLRKQGRIEEAYEAIRPMYAQHKGRYTTLCMFWTACDIFKKRMDEGRTDEAEKIYRALLRLLPRVEEITRELDINHASHPSEPAFSAPSASPAHSATAPDDSKLPWEQDPQPTSSAAAFLDYAHHRLTSTEQTQQNDNS